MLLLELLLFTKLFESVDTPSIMAKDDVTAFEALDDESKDESASISIEFC